MDKLEKNIIEGIKLGLEAAENKLCKVYRYELEKKLRKYCFLTIPVEMVATDAMVLAIEKIRSGEYKDHGKLLPYMIGIGKNLCSEIHKKKIKEIVYYDDMIFNYSHSSIAAEDVQDLLDDDIRMVREAIGKIDAICRELLILAFYKQLRPREIIQIMPELVSASRISNRKNKCLAKLKGIFYKRKSNQHEHKVKST
jgi:DNA-directed RNA polymerase specialized sigma24 family protein